MSKHNRRRNEEGRPKEDGVVRAYARTHYLPSPSVPSPLDHASLHSNARRNLGISLAPTGVASTAAASVVGTALAAAGVLVAVAVDGGGGVAAFPVSAASTSPAAHVLHGRPGAEAGLLHRIPLVMV